MAPARSPPLAARPRLRPTFCCSYTYTSLSLLYLNIAKSPIEVTYLTEKVGVKLKVNKTKKYWNKTRIF